MKFTDDRFLVEQCLSKDPLAWARLVAKYSPLVHASIANIFRKYSFLHTDADIEDIRQDLLASVWKQEKLRAVQNRHDISYWLSIVSVNAAIDHIRYTTARDAVTIAPPASSVNAEAFQELLEEAPSLSPSPHDEAYSGEIARAFTRALRELSASERLAVKLSLCQQKTHGEIASVMRLSGGTVSSMIKRAKDKLKKKMKRFLQEF